MKHQLTVGDALARLPGPRGERYVEVFSHGTMSVEHRFEDFSNNLAVWVMFYGPEGGEASR
jgi:hypothetical protein